MHKRKYLSREDVFDYLGIQVSREYNAVDWPGLFLGPANTLYRAFTSDATTTIDNPGFLINMFTGKWTMVGQVLRFARGSYLEMLKLAYDELRGRQTHTMSVDQNRLANVPNMYKVMFVDYKKVDLSKIKDYKDDFKQYQAFISSVKQSICKQCSKRDLSTSELADLKVFKPNKIATELGAGLAYFEKQNKEWYNFAQQVANYIKTNIVEYLIKNINDDGYIEK